MADRPLPAYRGDEPYIFVCYSHEDSAMVYREIQSLQRQGFNIWWDEGIDPGTAWRDELVNAIKRSAAFLLFVTPRSVVSQHCLRELHFAEEEDRPFLAVHLQPTTLPDRLRFSIGGRQAILAHDMSRGEVEAHLRHGLEALQGSGTQRDASVRKEPYRRHTFMVFASIAASALVAWLLFIAWPEWLSTQPESQVTQTSVSTRISLAVLPFTNMSGDEAQAYFGDGLADNLTTALADVSEFSVAPRSSAFQYSRGADIRRVGDELGVRYVLEGSFQKTADRVRVNVQLIDTESNSQEWNGQFDRSIDDLFDVQDEIVMAVVSELRPELISAVQTALAERPTESLSAWELYLRSTWAPGKGTNSMAAHQERLAFAEQAVKLDPSFGKAHYALADLLADMEFADPAFDTDENRARIDYHNERALSLAPDDPEVLARLAGPPNAGFDTNEARRLALERALQLRPSYLDAKIMLMGLDGHCNPDNQEVITELEELGEQLSPTYGWRWVYFYLLSEMYLAQSDFAKARDAALQSYRVRPSFWNQGLLITALVHLGEVEKATSYLKGLREGWPMFSFSRWAKTMVPRICADQPGLDHMQSLFRRVDEVLESAARSDAGT